MNFSGKFTLSPALNLEQYILLTDFAEKRHEDTDPSYYCQWVPSKDGKSLKWDGNEKFHAPEEWLEKLCKDFFNPWNIRISGNVTWMDEGYMESGVINGEKIQKNTNTSLDR